MTRRSNWTRAAALIGVATLGLGAVLAWAGPPKAAGGDDSLRHEIEDLAKIMLLRIEEARGEQAETEQRKDAKPSDSDGAQWASALANVEAAKLALKAYQDGAYPMERQTAESELLLASEDLQRTKLRKAWSDKEIASGRSTVSKADHAKDTVAFQKAEIALKKAEMQVDTLKKFTYPREIARLQAAIDAAERAVQQQKDQALALASKRIEQARQPISIALTEIEKEAILRLDEAMQLRDDRMPFEARGKLAEAERLWRDSEPSRIERRYAQLKDRIRRSADSARKEGR